MHGKDLHDFLFKLYDFTDYVTEQIKEDNLRIEVILPTLIFIERYFDSIGRDEIFKAAQGTDGIDPYESLSESHKRLDTLRNHIASLIADCNNIENVQRSTNETLTYWLKTNEKTNDE